MIENISYIFGVFFCVICYPLSISYNIMNKYLKDDDKRSEKILKLVFSENKELGKNETYTIFNLISLILIYMYTYYGLYFLTGSYLIFMLLIVINGPLYTKVRKRLEDKNII